MDQPGDGDSPEPRRDNVVSRLPWRYSPPGRRQLAAMATARLRSSGVTSGTRSAAVGTGGGRGTGRPDGCDVDDHIRLAVREESAANLGRAGGKLKAARVICCFGSGTRALGVCRAA